MKVNLRYYVETLKFPQTKALYPLFEAISNSIDAIEENDSEIFGEIIITLERNSQDLILEDTEENRELLPIENIIIKDNGVGFRTQNYDAFSEFSSEQKKDRGGKGLGRICWLKVFDKAEIKSTYISNGSVGYINFEFTCDDAAIHVIEKIDNYDKATISTEVKFVNCKNSYIDSIPKRRVTIAEEIITHFLPYFMVTTVPKIVLREEGLEDIFLDQVFEDFISEKGKRSEIKIKGHKFDVVHAKTKYRSQRNNDHRVYFIANSRVVESELVSQEKVANIPPKLVIEGEAHVYVGYIESDFLNENVNQARDSFDILKKIPEGELLNTLDWETIQGSVYDSAELYLNEFIEEARKQKDEKIREFINNEAPNYSYLYKNYKEELDKISLVNVEKGKLERELHQIHVSLRMQLKEEVAEVLSIPEGEISPEEYHARLTNLIENLNPTGKADLAEYIIHRKIVLNLLDKALKKKDSGKFSREDAIHSYIFPIKSSSDEINSTKHNLWLLDERLSLNSYIASDKPFSQIESFDNINSIDGRKRPDILTLAFTTVKPEETRPPYKSLDIFEFKRPMRDDYRDDENPYSQIIDYLTIIRNNEAQSKDGRIFKVAKGGVIYCHIVCDITRKMHDILMKEDFRQIGDEDWYIRFHTVYNAIIEVQSFDRLIEVALKRNQILFEKLGLD